MEINKKFKIQWTDIVNVLQLKAHHLTRENGLFDTTILSDCIHCQKGNLIIDIGFTIDDIRRLECKDLEISKMDIDFDDMIRIGFTKQDLLAFPWFPDSMVEMLGLKKVHLSAKFLNLKKEDFYHLIKTRKGKHNCT